MWKHCPHTQLGWIDVYYRADHPQTDFKRTPSGRIGIGLSARDTRWAQYSFQFAHEFCHALANFSNNPQQLVRYPRRANLWLEESLCENGFSVRFAGYDPLMADVASLSRLAELRSVAQRLCRAATRATGTSSPAGKSFLVWFQENQAALRQNSDRRDRNTIIAIQLLPIFEAEPRGWQTVAFLNRGSFNAEASLAQFLGEWRSQCPDHLRPFVNRLAAVFAVKLERLQKTE